MLAALPWLGCVGSPDQQPTRAYDNSASHGFALERMLSPEIGLDAPVPTPTPGSWPAAAFDGTNYLVVWEDFRTLRPMLYGARMKPDGTSLDPIGFPILANETTLQSSNSYQPALAFDGSNFLVVVRSQDGMRGVRVSPAGEVLDSDGFPISAAQAITDEPAIAFDGSNYLVVWSQRSYPPAAEDGLYWARVAPDGTVLDPGGVRAISLGNITTAAVSFDGSNYLLAWNDWNLDTGVRTIYGARLSPAGTLLDQAGFPIGSGFFMNNLAAAFDGTNHVVAWSIRDDYQGENFVYATRVTPQGTMLDPDEILVAVEENDFAEITRLDMTASNDRSIIVFSQSGFNEDVGLSKNLGIVALTAEGTSRPIVTSDSQHGVQAAIAAGNAGALLVWRNGEDEYTPYWPIATAVLNNQDMIVPTGERVPAAVANAQEVRGVASDGHIFFVIWTDTRDFGGEGKVLYGVRVAADGTVLDAPAIQLMSVADDQADVANVFFDGANFLVTWAPHCSGTGGNSQILAVRVSRAGELLDETPLYLPLTAPDSYSLTPVAATDGTHTLLVAEGDPDNSYGLTAVLMDQQGEPAGQTLPLVTDFQDRTVFEPAVAFDGTGYLVVWHDSSKVFGSRVYASGELVGQQITIATGEGGIARSTVAFGHGHYLVVWQDASGLHGTRVTPYGQVLDAAGLPIAAIENVCEDYGDCCHDLVHGRGSCASVVAADDGFMVAWRSPTIAEDPTAMDLHGAVLSQDGEVLDSFAFAAAPEREGMPMLAANADGQVLAAYTRFVPEAPYSARRAHARLLTAPGDPYVEPGPDAGVEPGPGPDAGGSPAMPGPGAGDGCSAGGSHPANALLVLLALGGLLAWRRRPGQQAVRE